MKTIGVVSTAALVALGVAVAVIGVVSIPDIKRYLAIRNM